MTLEQGQVMDTVMREVPPDTPVKDEDPKPTYRSFKKKYKKMRVKFDEDMRKSNDLFLIEQQANATVKRLAQMNNQILDLLLDVNSSPQIPADKRVKLSGADPNTAPLPLIDPEILSSLSSTLTSAQDEAILSSMQSTLSARADRSSLTSTTASKTLESLARAVPHPSTKSSHLAPELRADFDPLPHRHLSMDQIDEYLEELDSPNSQSHQAASAAPSQQEVSLRNPHSVYNWLRAHEPKVFLQDGEGSEKSSVKPAGAASRKRGGQSNATPSAASIKPESTEIAEEDGGLGLGYEPMEGLTPAGGKAKGKRKRGGEEDDAGYHPKQGRVEDGKGKKTRKPRAKKGEGEGSAGPKRSRKSAGKAGGGAGGAGGGGAVIGSDDAPSSVAVKEEDESLEP